ncbi:MAG: DUF1559 domain-containing protein, partial [Verrucomicrobia bacterium]|nr:DUF1559 domain-containing protein [Verrucomicrobiota bacterium]MBU1856940.1 DUF1559 domain-containing protein [Verrucomicrobiota bacterium]
SVVRRLSSGFTVLSSPVRRLSSVVCRLSSGFTLVELMVVVAIIAILLMLLIPNIRTMREKAWSSNCQNNLRQYGIAMNQYMADKSGYFIYPGAGGQNAGRGYDASETGLKGTYGDRVSPSGGQAGSEMDYWKNMIPAYIPAEVTIQSLSAGNSSIRVCPAVMQQIKKDGNFFDPDSPNFKGLRDTIDWAGYEVVLADFEQRVDYGPGYDANGKLNLDPSFTTYAINHRQLYKNKKDIPANVIAFIDWNARDGWWATLSYTNWMFNGTNSQGEAVTQDTPKWTNAWWLTEVGFHHLGKDNVYGANYVAMDGHVGWIGSNNISQASFTNNISVTNFTGM